MPTLRAMTEAEYAAWMTEMIPAYAQDKVASGQWSAGEAVELSAQGLRELLPQGLQTPGHFLYTIEDDAAQAVGQLWFAVEQRAGARIAYVYDIAIRLERRREGHAQRAFGALEAEARQRGLCGIALHVFGHDTPAQALYARLGFQPTNINLFKPIAPEGA